MKAKARRRKIISTCLMLVISMATLFADNVKWSWKTEYPDVLKFRYSFDNENWNMLDGSERSVIIKDVMPGTTMYLQQTLDGIIWSKTTWATWNGEEVEGKIEFELPDAPEMVASKYNRVTEIKDAKSVAKRMVSNNGEDFARICTLDGDVVLVDGQEVQDTEGRKVILKEDGSLYYSDGREITDRFGQKVKMLDNGRLVYEDGTLVKVEDMINKDLDPNDLVLLSKILEAGVETDESEPVIMVSGVKDNILVDVNKNPVLDAKGRAIKVVTFENGRVVDQFGVPVVDENGENLFVNSSGYFVNSNGDAVALYVINNEKGEATINVNADGSVKEKAAEKKNKGDEINDWAEVYLGGFIAYQDPGMALWSVDGESAKLSYGVDLRLALLKYLEMDFMLSFYSTGKSVSEFSSLAYIGPRIPFETKYGTFSIFAGFGSGASFSFDDNKNYEVNGGKYSEQIKNGHLLYKLGLGYDMGALNVPLAFQLFWATGSRDSFSQMSSDFNALSMCPDFNLSSVGISINIKL